jgi:hypothetical protein
VSLYLKVLVHHLQRMYTQPSTGYNLSSVCACCGLVSAVALPSIPVMRLLDFMKDLVETLLVWTCSQPSQGQPAVWTWHFLHKGRSFRSAASSLLASAGSIVTCYAKTKPKQGPSSWQTLRSGSVSMALSIMTYLRFVTALSLRLGAA